MKREIKFRGKRVDNGMWVYGSLIQDNVQSRITTIYGIGKYNSEMCEVKSLEVYPETIGQFTGLKDKNGKEIYENDICKKDYGLEDYYYVVKWTFAGFQLVTYKKANAEVYGISNGINQGYLEISIGLEVIGNIFDNPQLLEEDLK